MTIDRRLVKLEINRGGKAHPGSDAAFALLAAYLDTGGAKVLAAIEAEARCHAKTPLQAMKDWHKIKPNLFRKQPYYLPGCDS